MGNTQRDLGSVPKKEKKISKGTKHKERLKIMIFKNVGKVRTFKISSLLVVWAFVFFLFYIVATIFLVNKFFDVYWASKEKETKITQLSRKLFTATKELERSKQHIALLNDYIHNDEKQDVKPVLPADHNDVKPVLPADHTESSLPKLVDIEELKVKKDGSKINVDFRIVNTQDSEEPIGGYIFVIARIKDSDKSSAWVYPNSPLKDGLPVKYRNGERFFIHRFRSVSSKYTLDKPVNKTLIVEILVYDKDGKLILKKVIEA